MSPGPDVALLAAISRASIQDSFYIERSQSFSGEYAVFCQAHVGLDARQTGLADRDVGCAGDNLSATTNSQLDRSKRMVVAPSFGVAFNAFFNEFLGISLRWRGIPFKYNTGGTDSSQQRTPGYNKIDSDDRLRQFNNMFSVGLIFVLPPKIKTTD